MLQERVFKTSRNIKKKQKFFSMSKPISEKFSSSTLPLRCFLQMIDLSPKKVEIFNDTFEDSVEHETFEEITTEGAVKMEIQDGSI